ncbi:MAG: hypothetical protein V2G42_08270 [bacterium JZ-2024 1]
MARRGTIAGEVAWLVRRTLAIFVLLASLMVLAMSHTAPVILTPFVFSLPYPDRFVKGRERLVVSLVIPLAFDLLFSLTVPAYLIASLIGGVVLRSFLPVLNVKHPLFPMFAGAIALCSAGAVSFGIGIWKREVWQITPPDVFLYVALPYWIWGLARYGGFAPRDEFPVSF